MNLYKLTGSQHRDGIVDFNGIREAIWNDVKGIAMDVAVANARHLCETTIEKDKPVTLHHYGSEITVELESVVPRTGIGL